MKDSDHNPPTLEQLRQLSGFNVLDDAQLEVLCKRLKVHSAPAGRLLIPLGETRETVLYLLEGQMRLRAQDGAVKVIGHTSPTAKNPISRLRPSRHEVRTDTTCRYLLIDSSELDRISVASNEPPPSTYDVQDHIALPLENIESQLLIHVYEDLGSRQLRFSSIPNVSIQIGNAAIREELTTCMADWLLLDPVLALRVMRACNSRVGATAMASSLRQAVARLGTDTTRDLIVRSVMLEPRDQMPRPLQAIYRRWWHRSVRVATLCREMANASARFDPDFAALAGLMQRLGEGVAICYASSCFDEISDLDALERSIVRSGREIGQAVLTMWRMPREIVVCATEAGNWLRRGSPQADYIDLVLLAQLQVARDAGDSDLPDLRRTPAFNKLRLGREALDPLIMESARLAVSEVEALIETG